MTSPVVEQQDLQGVIGENAKIKPATVIQVIRINFNRSSKIFTYQKLYLKSVHKFYQPRRVVRAAGSQKSEKAKNEAATEGSLMPSIYTNRMNRLHAINEVRSRLINSVTIVKQQDLQMVMQVKKRKYNLQQKDSSMPSIQTDSVDYIPEMRAEEG